MTVRCDVEPGSRDRTPRIVHLPNEFLVEHADDPFRISLESRVVSHHAGGCTALMNIPQQLPDGLAILRIEISGRLVSQQHRRNHSQRPSHPQSLLLPARQLRRVVVHRVRHPLAVQYLAHPPLALLDKHSPVYQGEFDILEYSEVSDEVERPEDNSIWRFQLRVRCLATGLPRIPLGAGTPSVGVSSSSRIDSSVDLPLPDGPEITMYRRRGS